MIGIIVAVVVIIVVVTVVVFVVMKKPKEDVKIQPIPELSSEEMVIPTIDAHQLLPLKMLPSGIWNVDLRGDETEESMNNPIGLTTLSDRVLRDKSTAVRAPWYSMLNHIADKGKIPKLETKSLTITNVR